MWGGLKACGPESGVCVKEEGFPLFSWNSLTNTILGVFANLRIFHLYEDLRGPGEIKWDSGWFWDLGRDGVCLLTNFHSEAHVYG